MDNNDTHQLFLWERHSLLYSCSTVYACNDNSDALMSEQFFHFYDEYHKDTDNTYMGIYINIRVEKVVFINGSLKDQLEIVEFQDSD